MLFIVWMVMMLCVCWCYEEDNCLGDWDVANFSLVGMKKMQHQMLELKHHSNLWSGLIAGAQREACMNSHRRNQLMPNIKLPSRLSESR